MLCKYCVVEYWTSYILSTKSWSCKFLHSFDLVIWYECCGLPEGLAFALDYQLAHRKWQWVPCIGWVIMIGTSSHPRLFKWSNCCVLLLDVFAECLRCNQAQLSFFPSPPPLPPVLTRRRKLAFYPLTILLLA